MEKRYCILTQDKREQNVSMPFFRCNVPAHYSRSSHSTYIYCIVLYCRSNTEKHKKREGVETEFLFLTVHKKQDTMYGTICSLNVWPHFKKLSLLDRIDLVISNFLYIYK
jgi:hypothetical protein